MCENLVQQKNWRLEEQNQSSVKDFTRDHTFKILKGNMLTGKMNCQPVFSPAGLTGDTASWENPVVLLPKNLICQRKDAL